MTDLKSAMAICWTLMTALTEVGDGDLLDTYDRLEVGDGDLLETDDRLD